MVTTKILRIIQLIFLTESGEVCIPHRPFESQEKVDVGDLMNYVFESLSALMDFPGMCPLSLQVCKLQVNSPLTVVHDGNHFWIVIKFIRCIHGPHRIDLCETETLEFFTQPKNIMIIWSAHIMSHEESETHSLSPSRPRHLSLLSKELFLNI